jgi:DNA-binding MarR family transcriptional regulator
MVEIINSYFRPPPHVPGYKMIDALDKIIKFQSETNVKCLHNEVRIIYELATHGPLPSLEIMRRTGRSISAHNIDIKRLLEANILSSKQCEIDKRKKLFDISDNVKSYFR